VLFTNRIFLKIVVMPRNYRVVIIRVDLALKKEARMVLSRWSPVSDRIMSARLNSRYAKLTIIMLYAPTNDAER